MNGSRVSPVHQIISEDKQSHHYSTELSVSATKSHTGAICNLSLCYSTEGFSVRQGLYKFKSQDRFSRVISDFVKHFSDRLNSVSGLFSKCVSYLTCKERKKERTLSVILQGSARLATAGFSVIQIIRAEILDYSI